MEWIPFFGRNIGLLTVLYTAAVIELACPTGDFVPSAIALVVTLMVCLSRPTPAVCWAVAGGFLIDALSQGRLGSFVVAYGLITCLLLSVASSAQRTWWFAPALSSALAGVQPFVLTLIARIEAAPVMPTETLLMTAFLRGGSTACAAIAALLAITIVQRVWSPTQSHEPLALTNKWRMITD